MKGLPQWLRGKDSACNAGVAGLIPGLGRCPGGGHGNPLQYFCLENPTDRGAWQATVHWVAKSQIRLKQLNIHPFRISQVLFPKKTLALFTLSTSDTVILQEKFPWN